MGAGEVPCRLRRVQGGHWVDDRQPDLRDDQAGHVGLRPAGEPEAVDDRRVATVGLEEDPGWRGPRVETEDDRRLHRLLPGGLQLASAEPGQEPDHQGLRTPHDLLQVRNETREEDVRDGPDVLLVEDPLRRQRRLQLEPVRPSPGQVRPRLSPSWCRPRQPPRRRGLSTTSSSTMNFRYLYCYCISFVLLFKGANRYNKIP